MESFSTQTCRLLCHVSGSEPLEISCIHAEETFHVIGPQVNVTLRTLYHTDLKRDWQHNRADITSPGRHTGLSLIKPKTCSTPPTHLFCVSWVSKCFGREIKLLPKSYREDKQTDYLMAPQATSYICDLLKLAENMLSTLRALSQI